MQTRNKSCAGGILYVIGKCSYVVRRNCRIRRQLGRMQSILISCRHAAVFAAERQLFVIEGVQPNENRNFGTKKRRYGCGCIEI